MSADFWSSSQYKRLLKAEQVNVVHPADSNPCITLDDFKIIKMNMSEYITKMAKLLKLRQRVVATAITYMRRVYTSVSIYQCEPRVVAPSCLYLASKAEETPIHATNLVNYNKFYEPDTNYIYEATEVYRMELVILKVLNYYLVVFHPYRSLTDMLQDAGMGDEDSVQFTWGIVNDTYKMDLILIHPPHLITLACIIIASEMKEKDTTSWFEELHVDMNVVENISMEILDMYDDLNTDIEKRTTRAFIRLLTASRQRMSGRYRLVCRKLW